MLMFESLRKDAQRYYVIEGGREYLPFVQKIRVIIEAYGFHTIAIYRYGQWLQSLSVPDFLSAIKGILMFSYKILNYLMKKMYGISISSEASIAAGFYIGHFGGICIGPCRIGKNCSVHQQTKIGSAIANHEDMHPPVIGNNVWIGAHVIIENDVSIGDNTAIGAGAVVKKSVEEHCLVSGNPARIINKNYNAITLLGTTERNQL
ncbi:MAG: DapH/DapD/GlmU-related protein [Pseudomonadota bacterium]